MMYLRTRYFLAILRSRAYFDLRSSETRETIIVFHRKLAGARLRYQLSTPLRAGLRVETRSVQQWLLRFAGATAELSKRDLRADFKACLFYPRTRTRYVLCNTPIEYCYLYFMLSMYQTETSFLHSFQIRHHHPYLAKAVSITQLFFYRR